MIPVPELGWMFPDDACETLAGLVADTKPALILEAGSGRSTLVLAGAVAEYGGRVVSLEHDERYWAETNRLLAAVSMRTVSLRHAPLEGGPPWYAASAWDDLHGIGLLFVDGPPGSVAPRAREPALTLLRDRLLPGCMVVLDDTHRPDEREIWRRWDLADTVHVPHSEGALSYGRLR